MDICRAITFINFHIPLRLDTEVEVQYSTVGFFDGMRTERMGVHHNEEELKQLWKYGLNLTAKSDGQYAYQNVFCFSKDEWNECADAEFWADETNSRYPLCFVVFLQLRKYKDGTGSIAHQCEKFNFIIKDLMDGAGIQYSYCTIDKNDYVVCIKCRSYNTAVEAIKRLHHAEAEVVYSYSVFSISNFVLADLEQQKYNYLFDEDIDSICLKGITNSYDPFNKIALDHKYDMFCRKLVHRLYDGNENAKDVDYKIYDILGDDDFRLIARNVKLGILLQQFAPKGMLNYNERDFRFYLFSSNLVLNTLISPNARNKVNENYKANVSNQMEREFQSPLCDQLEEDMSGIKKVLSQGKDLNYSSIEKTKTFCNAIWQLLQSLKAIERAPTKKYDFWSLYQPLSMLIKILEEKLSKIKANEYDEVSKYDEIYDFIHKISMTLHGTLRTDIQFFQIRDFNVVVHYAPAKLRAFYALWVLKLSDFYNGFNEYKNGYSFICCPGMYRRTAVKPLFKEYKENKRLMLIMVPERHLYVPKRFSIVLAHEVSHYVGYQVRNRELRHGIWMKCCARVLYLEMNHFRYQQAAHEWRELVEEGVKESKLYERIRVQLIEEDKMIQAENGCLWPHMFHSRNSFEIIKKAFREVSRKYMDKFVTDECGRMNAYLKQSLKVKCRPMNEKVKILKEITNISYGNREQYKMLYSKFQSTLLPMLLKIFRHFTAEAYADLNVILTLNLSPVEYLMAFSEGELSSDITEGKIQQGLSTVVRIGIVMYAVCHVVKKKPENFRNTSFFDEWSKDNVLKDLSQRTEVNSILHELVVVVYAYTTRHRDCNAEISKYECVFNDKDSIEEFVNIDLDFFNDNIIWDLLVQYMQGCADKYVDLLQQKPELQKTRNKLIETFKNVAGDSIIRMAQEIENFLKRYEDEMNNNGNIN